MLRRKDLNLAVLETVRVSSKLTTVITPDGKVQTCAEATAYDHDLGLVVTVQTLEDTPAVFSSSRPCEDHGCSLKRASGKKNENDSELENIMCKTENFQDLVEDGRTPYARRFGEPF